MIKTLKNNRLEILTICAYSILLAIVSYFHEPFFDEAQAWLIARDSSLFDMIWHVLRYEGHTPLWYLFLYIPSHLGVPFEIGLKTVSFVFATLAATVFIKYAPFPLPVRLLAPFTYFFFYQYGVISRSYSLLMLALWIIAAVFPKRNEKPLLFSLLLALLGGVTVHGMIISFGIGLAWLVEFTSSLRHKYQTIQHKTFLSDKRFPAFLLFGIINLFYVLIIWPNPDKFTPKLVHLTLPDFIYRLLLAPSGAIYFSENKSFLSNAHAPVFYVPILLIGFFLLLCLFAWTYKNNMFLFSILPYALLSLFMTFVYFDLHHTGIYTLLFIFILWITLDRYRYNTNIHKELNDNSVTRFSLKPSKTKKIITVAGFSIVLLIQIYWSFNASFNDIRFPYAPAREISKYISNNGLSNANIFDYYSIVNNQNSYSTANMAVLAYFPNNIFYNQNPGQHNTSYAAHKAIDDTLLLHYLKSFGTPDFIIGYKDSLPFYKKIFSLDNYIPLKTFNSYSIWKDDLLKHDCVTLYIRKSKMHDYPQIKELERLTL